MATTTIAAAASTARLSRNDVIATTAATASLPAPDTARNAPATRSLPTSTTATQATPTAPGAHTTTTVVLAAHTAHTIVSRDTPASVPALATNYNAHAHYSHGTVPRPEYYYAVGDYGRGHGHGGEHVDDYYTAGDDYCVCVG